MRIKWELVNKCVSLIADDTCNCEHNERMRVFDEGHQMAVGLCQSKWQYDWKNILSVCFEGAATM